MTPVWPACSPSPAPSRTTTLRVGLVGHNPGLGELATALTGSGAHSETRRLAAKYPTGAVAALDFSVPRWKDVERNSGLLALYLTPSEFEAGSD